MAILRQSEQANLGVQDTRQGARAQVGSVGNRNPGSVVLDHTVAQPYAKSGAASWQEDLLRTLVGTASPYVQQIGKNLTQSAYLDGQAKAAAGATEAELESDPVTQMWATAGHRDMMNQLRVVDAQTKFEADLPKLAAMEPAEAEQYIAAQRNELLPYIEAGSNNVKQALVGKLALHERSAMTKYADARRKYIATNILRTQGAVLQSSVARLGNIRQKLMAEGGDEAVYAQEVDAVAGDLYQGTWLNNRLPYESKVAATQEMMEYALANNEIKLYDKLATTPMPNPDGTFATLFSHMPTDKQSALSNKRREVFERTSAFRNMEATQQKAVIDAEIQNGSYKGEWDDITKSLQGMLANGTIKEGEYQSTLKNYLLMKGEKADTFGLAQAYQRGDLETIYKMGSDPTKARKAFESTFAAAGGSPGDDLQTQTQKYLVAGMNGMSSAYSAVGDRLGVSVNQLSRPDGTIDQSHAQNVRTVFSHMDRLEQSAQGTMMANMLEGMDDSTQTKVLLIRNAMTHQGLSFEQAVTKADKIMTDESQMSKSEKAAIAGQRATDVQKAVQGYDTNGMISTGWNKLKSIVSSSAGALDKITPSTSPWSNDQTVAEYAANARIEVMKEAKALSMLSPGLSAEDVVTKAAANVAARTVTTEQGPLHLPAGTNKQKFFGLKENANDEEIGRAVSAIIKPTTPGGRISMTIADGKLNFMELNADGEPTTHFGTVKPTEVSKRVAEEKDIRFNKVDKISGAGTTVGTGNDVVSFSGRNTATVPDAVAFQFREGLTKREGIKNTLYKDKLGNPTIGVGLTGQYMPKPDADGRITKQAFDKAFEKATNDALYSGRRVAAAMGQPNNPNAVLLLSELAYQSGNNFAGLSKYQPVLNALRAGNKTAAVDAFKSTPAYRVSGPERQNHYLQLINQI